MPLASTRQNTAATNAQKYFRKAEQSDESVAQVRRTERQATAAKTAKLRGLRLAKEEADRAATEKQEAAASTTQANTTALGARGPRARNLKAKAVMKRMSY